MKSLKLKCKNLLIIKKLLFIIYYFLFIIYYLLFIIFYFLFLFITIHKSIHTIFDLFFKKFMLQVSTNNPPFA
jgi:hypothetical protein